MSDRGTQTKAEMIKHVEEKYGVSGIVAGEFRPRQITQGFDMLYAYPDSDRARSDEFFIKRLKNENGDGYYFEDTYYGFMIREDYENRVYEVAKKYFERVKIYCSFSTSPFPEEFTKVDQLESLFQTKSIPGPPLNVFVDTTFASTDEFNIAADEFTQEWGSIDAEPLLVIYYLDPGVFDDITRGNCMAVYSNDQYLVDVHYYGEGERAND